LPDLVSVIPKGQADLAAWQSQLNQYSIDPPPYSIASITRLGVACKGYNHLLYRRRRRRRRYA
jgi:hypothetical protein